MKDQSTSDPHRRLEFPFQRCKKQAICVPICEDMQLADGMRIAHPELVNLYGCKRRRESPRCGVRAFVEPGVFQRRVGYGTPSLLDAVLAIKRYGNGFEPCGLVRVSADDFRFSSRD